MILKYKIKKFFWGMNPPLNYGVAVVWARSGSSLRTSLLYPLVFGSGFRIHRFTDGIGNILDLKSFGICINETTPVFCSL